MKISTSCAFCGWRPAIGGAARNARPYRICATCDRRRKADRSEPQRPTVASQIRALAARAEVTVISVRKALPHAKHTSIRQNLHQMERRGVLVAVGTVAHETAAGERRLMRYRLAPGVAP